MSKLPGLWTMDGASPEKHEAAVAWFSGYQLGYILKNGIIPDWFHGIITRKAAEDLLSPKPPGYFLIRVSESRIGYTLSYQAHDRCRHFMIDVLPENHYMIVGESVRHKSLQDLVAYYRRVPILPFNELITVACGQASKNKVDYAELLFAKNRHPTHGPGAVSPSPPQWNSNVSPSAAEDIPPALPYRSTTTNNDTPNQSTNASPVPASCGPPRLGLYPCLEAELGALSAQIVVQDAKPVPLPRKRHCVNNIQVDHPPELPARDTLDPKMEQPCTRINGLGDSRAACNEGPLTQPGTSVDLHQPKAQEAKSVSNLTQLRKKFQKMRGASEEHTYAEINDVDVQRLPLPGLGSKDGNKTASENEYEELPAESSDIKPTSPPSLSSGSVSKSEQSLPLEYLPPPPFAPGY
ncbi:hematopoietic SH2 domain-containing protein homolog isoform X1 [Alosa alosa]|nr:hematopoietic SH2 domain-containing protein homolog isoform X1 [Alosa alosa]